MIPDGIQKKPRRRLFVALPALLTWWGLAGWWSLLAAGAPSWTRAIPFPVALLAALAWWPMAGRTARRGPRACMCIAVILLAAGFGRDAGMKREIAPITGSTFRVTQWTLGEEIHPEELNRTLERELPHVIVLNRPVIRVEGQQVSSALLRIQHGLRRNDIVMLSRFPLHPLTPPSLDGTEALFARVETPDGSAWILALDGGEAGVSPEAARQLADFVAAQPAGRPLLVTGGQGRNRTDAQWRALREHLRPAHEIAGFGWPYSWPRALPLFSLDHIWVNDEWTVHRSAYRRAPFANHVRQTVVLTRLPAP
ncbi:MAG TPA: hypothetical protein PKE12_12095 [Kiritimatiellia bacterium]|nr:hypothetical protein [Kiritimatiellia bacterium]